MTLFLYIFPVPSCFPSDLAKTVKEGAGGGGGGGIKFNVALEKEKEEGKT